MASYSLVVSRGYIRLVRQGSRPAHPRPTPFGPPPEWEDVGELDRIDPELEWVLQEALHKDLEAAWWIDPSPQLDPVVEADIDEALHPRRGDAGQSGRSRMNMRRLFLSLPWELLGPRPALISLTYPGEWKPWVATGRVWEGHRRAFERRWVRRWGEPLVGVWVKEFQASGRPHLHLYVGLPTDMAAEDFEGLRRRTLLRHRLEAQHGKHEGRKLLPAIAQEFGGEFAMWLRTAWSEIVGTQGHVQAHHARGVDVAVMFWSDEAEASADRTVVAEYLAREAGKWQQKSPPPGFKGIGRFYGYWGRSVGFQPEVAVTPLEPLVAMEVEARLERWVNWKLHVLRKGAPPSTSFEARRRGDGVTAFGLGPGQADRLLHWAEAAAARKRGRHSWGAGGEAAGALSALMRRVDLLTGEVLSVEEGGSPVEDVGVHGLEVAAHGRGRVAVAEDSLDVEQVEVVSAVGVSRPVKDPRGSTA